MKKNNFNILYLIIVLTAVCSCNKEEVYVYQQRGGIYFESGSYSYSFKDSDTPGLTTYVVNLPVLISGAPENRDREIEMAIPIGDTITTAEPAQYKVMKGVVKANEFAGMVPIELTYDKRMDDSIFVVRFELLQSNDFPEVKLNRTIMKLSFTNKVIQPANWSWLRWYLGDYSTGWWLFVQNVTGRKNLPYFPTHADKVTWWMSADDVIAYQGQVREALAKYNMGPDGPLLHDDGPRKGLEVVVPD